MQLSQKPKDPCRFNTTKKGKLISTKPFALHANANLKRIGKQIAEVEVSIA